MNQRKIRGVLIDEFGFADDLMPGSDKLNFNYKKHNYYESRE